MHALIVDNNQQDCAALVERIQRGGHTAVAVGSLLQARQAVQTASFDLCLLDLLLPDGSGLQLCNEIRERLGDRMVIMFVSRNDEPMTLITGLQLGADDFVGKDCPTEELLERIKVRHQRKRALLP